jgi:hypothetical protein
MKQRGRLAQFSRVALLLAAGSLGCVLAAEVPAPSVDPAAPPSPSSAATETVGPLRTPARLDAASPGSGAQSTAPVAGGSEETATVPDGRSAADPLTSNAVGGGAPQTSLEASPDSRAGEAAPPPGPDMPPAASNTSETSGPATRMEWTRGGSFHPSLLPLAQPLWSELSASQRELLQPFAQQWNALPSTEKRAWAELARRFPKMNPRQRERVEKRIADWAALSPEQRRVARANFRVARQVPREEVRSEWEHYQSMTEAQRSVLGQAPASGSNTAARHVPGATGLARVAAQPLPRSGSSAPIATDGVTIPSRSLTRTLGSGGTPTR